MFGRTTICLLSAVLVACTAAAEPSLDPEMKAVEIIRGRKFTAPVSNTTIERAELPAMLRKQIDRDLPYSAETWVTVLRAMQLVDAPPADVLPKLLDLYQAQVLAFYDPGTRTYYSLRQVPEALKNAGDPETLRTMVAVHELTHALQDQHFGIGRRIDALRKDTDASMAYHAVIEGEALLVMFAHMMAKAGVDLDAMMKNDAALDLVMAAAKQDQSIDPSTPKYFAESLKFPYLDGLRLVVQAYRRAGWKGVDALHANPPRSTREVMHPEQYFARAASAPGITLPPPASRADVLATEHLGEFHWAFLVGAANAQGLRSDRATILRGPKPTVLVETVWDSEAQAARFAAAYEAFLAARGVKASIVRNGASVKAGYGANAAAIEKFVGAAKKVASGVRRPQAPLSIHVI